MTHLDNIITEIKQAAMRGVVAAIDQARAQSDEVILNRKEAAYYLRVSERTVIDMEKRGSISSYRIPPCKKPLYKKSELFKALRDRSKDKTI